jgi:hypothetical protein
LDEERGEAELKEVASWRKTGRFPFPRMAAGQRERIADTLDYPPKGSPDARHPESLEAESAGPLSGGAASSEKDLEKDKKDPSTQK